jgi:nucleotide-binding universal stress UspA family protein
MYKKILVPLDGTKHSEAILPQVKSLAQQCGAAIVLLEVLEPLPPHATVAAPELIHEGAAQRASQVRQYVHGIEEQLREEGYDAQAIVAHGAVVETILSVAQETGVDLIAMASHGYTGLKRLLYGSVASEVLHRTRTPLLVLHAEDDNS